MTTDPTTLRTALEALIADGIEAFRLTREYVGDDVLPDEPGWSWFDWAQRARAALATPAPAADEARCGFAGCGGVRDDVYHEPCLTGGVFHDHKACHPFQPAPAPAPPTPPVTEPVAALGPSTKAGWALLSKEALNSRSFTLINAADIIAIEQEAAARAEVDVERLARALDAVYSPSSMGPLPPVGPRGLAERIAAAYREERA